MSLSDLRGSFNTAGSRNPSHLLYLFNPLFPACFFSLLLLGFSKFRFSHCICFCDQKRCP
jgi:hypothetical protein